MTTEAVIGKACVPVFSRSLSTLLLNWHDQGLMGCGREEPRGAWFSTRQRSRAKLVFLCPLDLSLSLLSHYTLNRHVQGLTGCDREEPRDGYRLGKDRE